jgi:hypothetical protein
MGATVGMSLFTSGRSVRSKCGSGDEAARILGTTDTSGIRETVVSHLSLSARCRALRLEFRDKIGEATISRG